MGYRSMRLFKEAISGQKNPAYCGAETTLGAYNRYEVARRNAPKKGDHSHTSRARAPKNYSEEDKLYIEPQNENGDMPGQPERLPLLPPHTKLQRRTPPVTILYYILIYKQP